MTPEVRPAAEVPPFVSHTPDTRRYTPGMFADSDDLDTQDAGVYSDSDTQTGNVGHPMMPPLVEPGPYGDGDLTNWANLYASYGLRVLPVHGQINGKCTCGGMTNCKPAKHPATNHGLKNATDNLDKVGAMEWANRNIGVAMGHGLLALDIDGPSHVENPGDPTGLESFAKLEADYTPLPKTWTQRTGSGGRHMFFKTPAGRKVKSSNAGLGGAGYPHIDVKAEGGYAILPPSRNLAGPYEWLPGHAPWDRPLADAPAWLRTLLVTENETTEGKTGTDGKAAEGGYADGVCAQNDRAAGFAGQHDTVNGNHQAAQDKPDDLDDKAKSAPDFTAYERRADGRVDVIRTYNTKVAPGTVLERNKYVRMGDRYCRPGPGEHSPSVMIFPPDAEHSYPRSYHHSQNDPMSDGHAHGSFDLLCRLEHQGDVKTAVKAAAIELGLDEVKDGKTTKEGTAPQYDSLNDVPANDALADLIIDWSKQKQTKPPEWIISGVLPAKGEAMMIAQPKAGKSTVATDMALCIATGRPWMGRELKQGRVLYIALEAESDLMIRVAAWLKYHNVNETEIAQTWRVWDASRRKLDLSRFADAALLVGAIKAAFKGDLPILVVVDTLSRVRGNLDENGQEMQILFNFVAGIKDAIKATFLLIHHEGKDATKGARGSNVSQASEDVVMRVVNKDDKGCWVECSDMRSTKKFDPIPFQIKSIDLPDIETPVGVAVSTTVEGTLSKGEAMTLRALFQLLQYPGAGKHPKGPYRKELAQRATDLGLSLREFNDGIRDLTNRNPKPVVSERDGVGVRYNLTEDGRKLLSGHKDHQTTTTDPVEDSVTLD